MQKILWLTFVLTFTNPAFAKADCPDTDATWCVVIQSSDLDCKKSSSSDYLNSCIATVGYKVNNSSNMDAEAKVSCNVVINYLKSVMGIRDSVRQRDSQTIELAANGSDTFEMPVTFNFATQTEANNAEIKSVKCRVDAIQP